jgi:predicted secreted protein
MPPSQILPGKGAQLYRRDPNSLLYVAIPQCRIIPSPSATQTYADATNHDSPGSFEENIPTIKTGDETACVLVFHPDIAIHKQLYQDFIDQTKLFWRTIMSNTIDGWEYEARVSKFDVPQDFSAPVFLNWSLKVTGLPVMIEIS